MATVMADPGEWLPRLVLSRPLLEAGFLSTGPSLTVPSNFIAGDHCVEYLKAREEQMASQ